MAGGSRGGRADRGGGTLGGLLSLLGFVGEIGGGLGGAAHGRLVAPGGGFEDDAHGAVGHRSPSSLVVAGHRPFAVAVWHGFPCGVAPLLVEFLLFCLGVLELEARPALPVDGPPLGALLLGDLRVPERLGKGLPAVGAAVGLPVGVGAPQGAFPFVVLGLLGDPPGAGVVVPGGLPTEETPQRDALLAGYSYVGA